MWQTFTGHKVTLPAHKQYFFAGMLIVLMLFNATLFARFQRSQEQLADLNEDHFNELQFREMRIKSAQNSHLGSANNSQLGSGHNSPRGAHTNPNNFPPQLNILVVEDED